MAYPRDLPPRMVERARAHAAGRVRPVRPRPAATVLLLRDRPGGVEAYLLRRSMSMPFAGGMYAFPGGSVDPRDVDATHCSWAGPGPEYFAERLGCDPRRARGFVHAAVRETYEESGVLLAGPAPDSVVADISGDDWEADRRALVGRALALADFLVRRGLMLRADLLGAWAHWVTPEFEDRRFDTRFFVAALPGGQRTRDVSGEADRVLWMRPGDAVARCDTRQMAMLPPTAETLREISAYRSVAEVLAAAPGRDIHAIMPAALLDGERVSLVLPGEPGFPT
ncbi:MAG: NUDIX hydrolase [Carbonactinosporaceae bacterium]